MAIDILVKQLARDEGKVTRAGRHILYKCPADRWTLGYGRNVEDRGISDTEAMDWLITDARDAMLDAASLIPSWLALDEIRRDAIANMCFNLGAAGLAKFHNFLDAVDKRDWPRAKAELVNSKWYGQVGARAARIADEIATGTRADS